MKLYNTATNQKEEFVPLSQSAVKIYACGITTNGELHLGHVKQAVVFDVISQYFRYLCYDVVYVRNYTDIDDKIIDAAKKLGVDPIALSSQRIEQIDGLLSQILVSDADIKPRVSDHIEDIITFVSDLIDKGYAYVTQNGDVYYDIKKCTDYGKLSHRKIDDLYNSVRIENEDNKRDKLDFCLWKISDEGEYGWESPWGKGRPGWHIECSALIRRHLGKTIDIHGGGLDLIFPHHENEIAQSEAANGCTLSNYWIYNGLVTVAGKKMSKSLGNFVTFRELIQIFDAEVIRFHILSGHYSSSADMSMDALKISERNLYYFYSSLLAFEEILANSDEEYTLDESYLQAFDESMQDDFNTAKYVAYLYNLFAAINKTKDPRAIFNLKKLIEKTLPVTGLLGEKPSEYVLRQRKKYLDKAGITEDYILQQIQLRIDHKANKRYAEADQIRNTLDNQGIILKDTKNSTQWDIKDLYTAK